MQTIEENLTNKIQDQEEKNRILMAEIKQLRKEKKSPDIASDIDQVAAYDLKIGAKRRVLNKRRHSIRRLKNQRRSEIDKYREEHEQVQNVA